MSLSVILHESWKTLEPWADRWDRWTQGNPFRSWDWVTTWWSVYGMAKRSHRLHVLSVHQGDSLVGFAPLFTTRNPFWGWVLRFLSSGEVCGDDLGWVAPEELQEPVGRAIAQALHHGMVTPCSMVTGATSRSRSSIRIPVCDQIDFDGVRRSDRGIRGFLQELRGLGWEVDIRLIEHCWQILLPKTWEEFLQAPPRPSMRKKIRKIQNRYLIRGGVNVHTVFGTTPWEEAWSQLVNLHQARRSQLSESGAFASKSFLRFHREILGRWLPSGKARLVWLEWQGQAIAAEYLLVSDGIVRAYQSGMNPQFGYMSPGFLANLVVIQQAITEGYGVFDFLRGDEPYKADWGALPVEMVRIRAVPRRVAPRFRLRFWQTAKACLNALRKKNDRQRYPSLMEHDVTSDEVLSPTVVVEGTIC